jgi:hypothetical protein
VCLAVPVSPVQLSEVRPVPWSAARPPLLPLMPERRPPLPVLLLSRLRRPLWRVAGPVVPARQVEVLPVAALVQVVLARVVPARAVLARVVLVRVVTRVLSVAVPRLPVPRAAVLPLEVLPRAARLPVPRAARLPVLVAVRPLVVVLRSVVVHPSEAARLPELRSWTRPECLPERHWSTHRSSDR